MKMQSAVEEYLVEIEVRKYTPKTIRSYRCNLNLFLRFCAEKLHVETVEALTPAVVRQFSRCMSEAERKGTYINGVLKSIKSFIQYCYEEGYGGFDTRKTFKWCKEEKPVITAFSPEQVRSMLQSCRGHDYLSLRDYAILTLLFETGIRCWELCCIREEDIHDDFIIINGKNHKQRVVPITPVLKKAMLRYESGKEKYFMLRPHDAFYFLSFHGRQRPSVRRIPTKCSFAGGAPFFGRAMFFLPSEWWRLFRCCETAGQTVAETATIHQGLGEPKSPTSCLWTKTRIEFLLNKAKLALKKSPHL